MDIMVVREIDRGRIISKDKGKGYEDEVENLKKRQVI